ncbi:MAG: hypothetical protein R2827_10795 [Bdellovibrionales bacterium]
MNEIIDWAVTQEDWKQDIVRRVLDNGDFTSDDVNEIKEILLHQNGYLEKTDFTPIKIDKASFVTTENSAKTKVVLKKIESPTNVNALTPQAKLQFAFNGLTIVYGENGSGKSGYSRILKKCCKAREVDSILPNVFSEDKKGPSKATVHFSVNNKDQAVEWIDGQYRGGPLDQLVVYDNKCGKIQVNDKNELIYLPYGTDVFKKLIDCIVEVKKQIEALKPKEISINTDKIDESSEVLKKIKSINKSTEKEKDY